MERLYYKVTCYKSCGIKRIFIFSSLNSAKDFLRHLSKDVTLKCYYNISEGWLIDDINKLYYNTSQCTFSELIRENIKPSI